MIRKEISILSLMDHPNIIKYVESFEDERFMYIVTEFIPQSKDLQEIVVEHHKTWDRASPLFSLNDVRTIMKMVL